MNKLILLAFTVVILIVTVNASSPRCEQPGTKCPTSPNFCCEGCCKNGVCIKYDTDPVECATNPCSTNFCAKYEDCVAGPVVSDCRNPPCRRNATCKTGH
ncbi:hypothetical protein C0J52_17113 [Blattella germanica]|nr:hypothetical protein C0J52_17113 [Blattella germanica]